MQSNNKIGQRIEQLRKERGLTQGSLAEKLHVKRETVCQWETGVRDLKTGHLIALAETLDVSADYLLGLTNSTQKESKPQRIISDYTGFDDKTIEYLHETQSIPVIASKTAILSSLVTFFCKDRSSSYLNYYRQNASKARNEFIVNDAAEKVLNAQVTCSYIGYLTDYIIECIGYTGVSKIESIQQLRALDQFINEYELYYDLSVFEAQNAVVEMIKTKYEVPGDPTKEILQEIQKQIPSRIKEIEEEKTNEALYDAIINRVAEIKIENDKAVIYLKETVPEPEEF